MTTARPGQAREEEEGKISKPQNKNFRVQHMKHI